MYHHLHKKQNLMKINFRLCVLHVIKTLDIDNAKKNELSFVISGRQLLGIPESEPVSAVLEEDGTEISDEDYFAFIRHNTTIMLLRTRQKWMPVGAGNQMRFLGSIFFFLRVRHADLVLQPATIGR